MRGERGLRLLVGRLGWGRGFGVLCGVGLEARGAGRVRGIGSIALSRKFRARRPSGPGARWRFAGLVGRGRGS